jgi:Flp pilus assembly protein TadG
MQGSKELMLPTMRRRARRTASKGQALVEMSLILPVVFLLLVTAYTGSDAMHQAIGLTSAARAGAIVAAHDLQIPLGSDVALSDAVNAVNAEEGVSNVYTSGGGCSPNCVTLNQPSGTLSTITMAQITVTHWVVPDVALLAGIQISASASARSDTNP